MKYYVIADIHGRYDLLREAVNAIEKDSANESDTRVITLGDYIDRGPDSKSIIEYLMNRGSNWTCLQGNHEAMLVQTIRKPLSPDWWLGNGGVQTYESYGGQLSLMRLDRYYGREYVGWDPHVIPPEHINWLESLPLYHETEKQIFVHAGVPFDGPLEEQAKVKNIHGEYDMQWMLYGRNDGGGWNDKHVVHGHHQHADGPHTWSGRTNLDCWAYHTGRLVIGVFDDTQHKALKFIEVRGDDYEKPAVEVERTQQPEMA